MDRGTNNPTGGVANAGHEQTQSYEGFFAEAARCIRGLKASNLTGSAITYANDLERNLQQLGIVLGVSQTTWSTQADTVPSTA